MREIVKVKWDDAITKVEQTFISDIEPPEDATYETVGLLISMDDTWTILCATISEDGEEATDILYIPTGCVREITKYTQCQN